MDKKSEKQTIAMIATVLLVALTVLVWHRVVVGVPEERAEIHFLNVGQGDATLMRTAAGMTMLVDAGPGTAVVQELEQIGVLRGNYIDLAVVTHPQKDHFEGFLQLLNEHRIGAFLVNGRTGENADLSYGQLLELAHERRVPVVVVGAGDAIRHDGLDVDVLLPNQLFLQSGEPNETSIVLRANLREFTALLTGDIGTREERYLAKRYPDLQTDVLKVAHHGSRFSSAEEFVRAVSPKVAVVQAGENSYGHPAKEALERLRAVGARVFRNDMHGTISILKKDGKLRVFGE